MFSPRVQARFEPIFFDPAEGFFHNMNADSVCLADTGNHDARTEGMIYGMMMCVRTERQKLFDKLWRV